MISTSFDFIKYMNLWTSLIYDQLQQWA